MDIRFLCLRAEEFTPTDENRFFLFNPFSLEILHAVLGKLLASYYETPRVMRLFFYYPSEEYVRYLMTAEYLSFLDEIDCRELFHGTNPRKRVLIFDFNP